VSGIGGNGSRIVSCHFFFEKNVKIAIDILLATLYIIASNKGR